MIIENEFTRAERKQKEAEALAFEKTYFEDETMNELINEWRINDET